MGKKVLNIRFYRADYPVYCVIYFQRYVFEINHQIHGDLFDYFSLRRYKPITDPTTVRFIQCRKLTSIFGGAEKYCNL